MTKNKKSILFIMKYPLKLPYNLKMKFDGQMHAARQLGYDVCHIAWDNRYVYLIEANKRTIVKKARFAVKGWYMHTKAFTDIYASVRKILKKRRFDYVYMRRSPLNFSGWRMLSGLHKSGSEVVVEIPTYPSDKERHSSAIIRFISKISSFFWKRSVKYIDRYAIIGVEPPEIYEGKPVVSIENGVSVHTVPVRKPALHETEIHVLALASMSVWHGYDRLLTGLSEYKGDADIIIHMVGGDGDGSLERWKKLVDELNMRDRVIFEGPVYGDALTEMFSLCDIGIASLGMYRIGLTIGYVLKLREYMARGIPFVYAAQDPGLEAAEISEYALKVPNDDSPVDIAALVRFAKECKSKPGLSADMRKYAEENMSWKRQIEKALAASADGES